MRSDDIFNDIDDKTADRLAKEYPVLRDEQKERLYAMSKRKFDIKIDNSSIDVSGVEKYRRPRWFKGVSVAAAAVLLVAGIGGSMYYISRNGQAPATEVEESISETTEVTTEALTEEATEIAEEVDAEAVAKELIDGYREFMCVLYGGDLEVDKSDIITRTVKTDFGQFERDFYRVTDPKYPTWADIEKRCYEILDTETGKKILEVCTEDTEDVTGDPFFCVTEDGYYIETGIHNNGIDPLSTSEYDMNAYTDENGNIIASVTETELSEVHDYPIPETTFTIANTEKGWRISDVTEKPLDEGTDNSTDAEEVDAEAVAKALIDGYRELIFDLHGGGLEVDKSDIITRTITIPDTDVELDREYYRVTDSRYPTWNDIEKRGYEILDTEFGQVILNICNKDTEDIIIDPVFRSTEDGYYIEVLVHDYSIDPLSTSEYDMNVHTDENGNIIASVTETELREPDTTFTIVKTANGWRISDVMEKPL